MVNLYKDYYKNNPHIVRKITYMGYAGYIVSYGTHPCAYVEVPWHNSWYNATVYDLLWVQVHGGITFSGKLQNPRLRQYMIGWDYAHAGDFYNYHCLDASIPNHPKDTKYTLEQIINDCESVIQQIEGNDYGFNCR